MHVFVGTSGWLYKDWGERFYPKGLKDQDKLPYLAEFFQTVEVNSTFYNLPSEKSVQHWYHEVPKDFRFVVKLNRYITHNKKLIPDAVTDESIHEFCKRVHHLREKLGAVLVQLPPSLRADPERLVHLAQQFKKAERQFHLLFPLAIEFRHESWFSQQIFALMQEHDMANVIIDSPNRWPASRQVTATFAYIRFHGSKRLYASRYTQEELKQWAEFIRDKCTNCQRVFAYFNNDHNAFAIENALSLKEMLADNPR